MQVISSVNLDYNCINNSTSFESLVRVLGKELLDTGMGIQIRKLTIFTCFALQGASLVLRVQSRFSANIFFFAHPRYNISITVKQMVCNQLPLARAWIERVQDTKTSLTISLEKPMILFYKHSFWYFSLIHY
jgi:hypothetical protein